MDATPGLNGKVAIVTGASRGIGQGIALRLARAGVRIALVARDRVLLDQVKGEIEDAGGTAHVIALDLRERDSGPRVASETASTFGGINFLINNAGATKRGAFLELTDDDWEDGYALKLFGAVRLTRAAWPHLKASSGSVVNIAGIGGRTPSAEFSIGGSVNAAVMAFTKSMADLGIADGVQVNLINPGSVRTDRLARRIAVFAKNKGLNEMDAAEQMIKAAGINRFGEVADVANLVAFIISNEGCWFQGSLIDLDGGETKSL